MKTRLIAISLASAAAGVLCATAATAAETQAQLQAEAKVTEFAARATALARVPHGVVRSSELERENGKLIWSYDVKTPVSKNITEVQVDAVSGLIVDVDVETPKDQAKEAAVDMRDVAPARH